MKVLAIRSSSGEYNGTKYSNYYLLVDKEQTNQNYIGFTYEVAKIKASVLVEEIKKQGLKGVNDLLNRSVVIYYNRYGVAERVELT